jgi:hemolysin-activating ACP:hemolysin acyltransferase
MQHGPLYRTMFPQSNTITDAQREEIIRWYVGMLEDAFQDQWESFSKAYNVDGTPVGFCGWTVIERNHEHQVEANDDQAIERPKEENGKKATWVPETIDIDGLTIVSKALRTERDRVLKDLDNICRKLDSCYGITTSLLSTGFYM